MFCSKRHNKDFKVQLDYSRYRDSKNRLAYNEFAYKKTKDDCKLEDRFQKKGHFRIAYTQNRR